MPGKILEKMPPLSAFYVVGSLGDPYIKINQFDAFAFAKFVGQLFYLSWY